MPIFTKDSRKILFVHIPKTGGTSVESHFTKNGWKMDLWSSTRNGGKSPSDQHLLYEDLKARITDVDDIYSFTVVRNPVRRLISEWRWQRWQLKNVKDSLAEFIQRVADSLTNDKIYWDNHWRPQIDFIDPAINRICKLETLKDEYPIVISESGAGFDSALPHVNASKTLFEKYVRWRFKDTLTEENLRVIKDIYATDFENFGYDDE